MWVNARYKLTQAYFDANRGTKSQIRLGINQVYSGKCWRNDNNTLASYAYIQTNPASRIMRYYIHDRNLYLREVLKKQTIII